MKQAKCGIVGAVRIDLGVEGETQAKDREVQMTDIFGPKNSALTVSPSAGSTKQLSILP